jgi:Tol biopolymer transport system component
MRLWQIPANGGESRPLGSSTMGSQREPDMAPNGRGLLFSNREDQLDIDMVALSGDERRAVSRDVWRDRFPSFSPDGRHLVWRSRRVSGGKEKFFLVLHELGTASERLLAAPEGLRDFGFCSAEQLVFVATRQNERLVGRLSLNDNQETVLVSGFQRTWSPSCHPDGDRIVFVGQRKAEDGRGLYLVDEKKKIQRLAPLEGLASYPSWSPDGTRIALRWAPSEKRLGEAELRVIWPDGSHKPKVLTRQRSFGRSQRRLRWSPDGRWLYYLEAEAGGARLHKISTRTGKARAVKRIDQIHTFDFDLSADGRWLVIPRLKRDGDIYLLTGQPAG